MSLEMRLRVMWQQIRHILAAVVSALLLVAAVALVYMALENSVITLDMTEGRRFTLSQETREVLHRIDRSIQITGFYPARLLPLRQMDDAIFRLYEVESGGRIRRQYIDPDEQPALAEAFGARGDDAVFVSFLTSDGAVDFSTIARVPRGSNQERDLTQAIARLLLTGTFKVYFDIAHGELDRLDSSQQGLSGINSGMQESGLITQSLNLAELAQSGSSIPDDASALILARPTSDLNSEEITMLDAHLQRGGALFIMADALLNEGRFLAQDSAFNQFLLERFGLRALDAVVVDPAASGQSALDVMGAAVFTENDIGQRLDPATAPTLFRIVRALEVSQTKPAQVTNGRVIASSEHSFGETDLRPLFETNIYSFDSARDLPGPHTLVAWAWDEETGAKIVLVGDSDFVTNGYVGSAPGNAILFTDSLAWLTSLGEQIRFAPQAFTTGLPLVFVRGQTLDSIALVTVVLMPGTVLLVGLAVWLRRARR